MSGEHMDFETVKMISESAARAVGDQVADTLRDEIRRNFDTLETNLTSRMELTLDKYFGDMRPADHIIAHANAAKALEASENNKRSFWQATIEGATKSIVGIIAAALIFYAGAKFQVNMPPV